MRGAARAKRLHQPRQDQHFHRITHRHREAGFAQCRVEALALLDQRTEGLQRLAQRLDQAFGERRRRQVAALADEQRIVEQLAQSRQRVADRRLREVEPLGGPADAAFGDDRVEHDQEVEIDAR